MNRIKPNGRNISIFAFSFMFAYILAFLFEGKVLYSFLDEDKVNISEYIISGIIAHFTGLFSCGFFCKTAKHAKAVMLLGMSLCFMLALPFLFDLSRLRLPCLIAAGYAAGCGVAAWGYFLKEYTPNNQRIKSCADVLIISNIIMIVINVITINISPLTGLVISMFCLLAGIICTMFLPAAVKNQCTQEEVGSPISIRRPMIILFLFVAVITVNSGLMYQVINPEFEHLTMLASWYWAAPYLIGLIVMRNLPTEVNRTIFLYIGMGMIICAFIGFMLLGRSAVDYCIVDTLMLGACGIFDLFWWSLIGETLAYTKNPAMIFGIGLSANVFGVLGGDIIGFAVTAGALPKSQIAVIALCVVCVTLTLLPPLNRQFVLLLKTHAYLYTYSALPKKEKVQVFSVTKPLDTLTAKEACILELLLEGKSNREIALAGNITENTVKTHLKNIYSKYAVATRAELISLLLRNSNR